MTIFLFPTIIFMDIYMININMNIDVNHPNFLQFLDNVTNTILNHVTISGYFQLTSDKKLGVQYIVFKLMKTSLRIKGKLTAEELKAFTVVLCKKNEENENYELAAILNDITKNFDSVYEKTETKKSTTKTPQKSQTKKK